MRDAAAVLVVDGPRVDRIRREAAGHVELARRRGGVDQARGRGPARRHIRIGQRESRGRARFLIDRQQHGVVRPANADVAGSRTHEIPSDRIGQRIRFAVARLSARDRDPGVQALGDVRAVGSGRPRDRGGVGRTRDARSLRGRRHREDARRHVARGRHAAAVDLREDLLHRRRVVACVHAVAEIFLRPDHAAFGVDG